MADPLIAGAAMTRFGRHPEAGLADLAEEAVAAALADAGIGAADVDVVVAGNAIAGLVTGQEMVRAQMALRGTALAGLPMINVENACATSSTALHVAALAVESGRYDCAVALGTEKMIVPDRGRAFAAISSAADVEHLDDLRAALGARTDAPAESFFMDVYASMAQDYMARSGATARDFAEVAVKNHRHAVHNPHAQYREEVGVEEVLASRAISGPLTALMCSPLADGAAAVVVCSPQRARQLGCAGRAVRLRASAVRTGLAAGGEEPLERRAADAAWAQAGLGPQDVHVAEVHDAVAPAELMAVESLDLCGPGGAVAMLADGDLALGGRLPVNPSGGLVSKGHPLGATGCGQVVELVTQLRGEAGARQVDGARVAVAENAGGYLHPDPAVCVVTVLSRD